MSESLPSGAPFRKPEVTRERLTEVMGITDPTVVRQTLNNYLSQQLDKRINARNVEERFRVHFETAQTLQAVGLLNDAREMYEDILVSAQEYNEPDLEKEALIALRDLPTLH